MVIELCAIFAAAAAIVLAVYAIFTLKKAQSSLDHINETLNGVQREMERIGGETMRFMQNANRLTVEAHHKLKTFDPFFRSVTEAGEAVHQVASSVKQAAALVSQTVTGQVEQAVHKKRKTMTEAAEWANLAANLWLKWKSHRRADANEDLSGSG